MLTHHWRPRSLCSTNLRSGAEKCLKVAYSESGWKMHVYRNVTLNILIKWFKILNRPLQIKNCGDIPFPCIYTVNSRFLNWNTFKLKYLIISVSPRTELILIGPIHGLFKQFPQYTDYLITYRGGSPTSSLTIHHLRNYLKEHTPYR
jgi:hypothetical protein